MSVVKDTPLRAQHLLLGLDLTGTAIFGFEGAMSAIAGQLDPLGVMVLSFASALGGGVIRDVLIGAIPPAALRQPRYPLLAFSGGALGLLLHAWVGPQSRAALVVVDAAGLSLFAMAGAQKALAHGLHPFIAILLAAVTASGGGIIRDVFLAHVPRVLYADIYATAALAGATVMVVSERLGLPARWAALAGGVACFGLRVVSVWQHWNLPHFA